jgi:hypothetical protein
MGKGMLHARPAHTKEALPGPGDLKEGLTGRIDANGDIPEYLSTFQHNTFFSRFFIIENVYNTSF